MPSYDALLVLSFGGPESPDEVMPFLENVLRGRNVPRDRLLAVAEHYYHYGGRSPINDQNRALIAALKALLDAEGPPLPVFWGNRNWHPLLADTLREMAALGVRRALAFVTSAYSSYSACRQYLEDIDRARAAAGPDAPQIDKLRAFYNHPGFIETMAACTRAALAQAAPEARAIFTAHSVPLSMARTSDYQRQICEACRLVAEAAGIAGWTLAWQSRSGAPGQPWLEPDILDLLRAPDAPRQVVLIPIGFISDHMEVVYDLDYEAARLARDLGITIHRAATAGTHPRFIRMIRELILERTADAPKLAIGGFGPNPDICPPDCCPAPPRPPSRP